MGLVCLRSEDTKLRVAHLHASPVFEVACCSFVFGLGGLLVDDLEHERPRRQVLVGKECVLEDLSERGSGGIQDRAKERAFGCVSLLASLYL